MQVKPCPLLLWEEDLSLASSFSEVLPKFSLIDSIRSKNIHEIDVVDDVLL